MIMEKNILTALIITLLMFAPLLFEHISKEVFSIKMKSAVIVIDVGHGGCSLCKN